MKAVVIDRYGPPDVLRLEEVDKPTPGAGEVLVRVDAAGLATGDHHVMRGSPFMVRLVFGLRRPKVRILGSDVAGRVEAVGEGATAFAVGDAVFGALADAGFGGWAEYVTAPEDAFVPMPQGVGFADAAAIPGSALAALQALRDQGELQAGQSVLVNGASGGVGTFAVQIAKSLGARVTGVCSARNADLVRSLGADEVIDYAQKDFRTSGVHYDVVMDAAARRPVRETLKAVAPGGTYVFVGGKSGPMMQAMLLGPVLSAVTGKKVKFFIAAENQPDLLVLKELAEKGELIPHIDGRYTLEQVPEAMRHQESGRSSGKLVILPGATGPA